MSMKLGRPDKEPSPRAQVPLVDHDAERAVVGCVLTWPGAFEEAAEAGLRPEHFSLPGLSHAFDACGRLAARGEQVDHLTVTAELATLGLSGPGAADLASTMASAPVGSRVGPYADIVLDRARRRQLALMLAEASAIARGPGSFEEVAGEVDRRLTAALADDDSRGDVAAIGPVVDLVLDELRSGGSARVATGLGHLDRALAGGFVPGSLVVLGARPSMGKTSLSLSIARRVAERGSPVLFVSAEQGRHEIAERVLLDTAKVPGDRVRPGPVVSDDLERLSLAASGLADLPLYVLDEAASLPRLSRAARKLVRTVGLGLVVVDYLQLLLTERGERREREVAELSRGCKVLARDLGVPVLAVSQLNRLLEGRSNKRPVLSDLRDSGQLEQDADVVLFLYRDEVYNPQTTDPGVAEVRVAKNRNGPTGTVRLAFLPQRMAFYSLDTIHDGERS